ncbi:hypothetical protein NDU88_004320 [Pleurodeles waltl]|uniref:Uncharacterized protein n=1 Tax=Pleurodeles waltl TaxID=8319 RepID=A0AAV7QBY4_PLEWA|nr:hypothetical protein NDU88_004320 [Pleurodeles waltl]
MVRRVQEWEVANQSVFRAEEQIEFVDEQGSVLRGTISGVTREDGSAGSAQVRLHFWQQDSRAYHSGCEAAHVHERHGLATADQRLGRPAGFRVPVEIKAPPVHRLEERVQSGATIPASRSAISGLVTEELDYEDEVPVLGVRAAAAQKATSSGWAVQCDRLSCRRELAGNLRREFYSVKMEVRLPREKVQLLISLLEEAVRKPKLELRQAQIILGYLNFACKVIRVGRAFCRRLGFAMRGAVLPYHHIRLRVVSGDPMEAVPSG